MKKIQNQLKSVAKTLVTLTKKVEMLAAELEGTNAKPAAKRAGKAKAAPARMTKAKAAKAAKPARAKKTVKAPKAESEAKAATAGKGTVLDSVYDVIKRARNGASIATLKKKTDLEARQLSNALYKLTKKGAIEARSRGVYFKK